MEKMEIFLCTILHLRTLIVFSAAGWRSCLLVYSRTRNSDISLNNSCQSFEEAHWYKIYHLPIIMTILAEINTISCREPMKIRQFVAAIWADCLGLSPEKYLNHHWIVIYIFCYQTLTHHIFSLEFFRMYYTSWAFSVESWRYQLQSSWPPSAHPRVPAVPASIPSICGG